MHFLFRFTPFNLEHSRHFLIFTLFKRQVIICHYRKLLFKFSFLFIPVLFYFRRIHFIDFINEIIFPVAKMSPLIKENITQSWKRVVSFTDFSEAICYFQNVEDFLSMTILKEVCFTQLLAGNCIPNILYISGNSQVLHISSSIERLLSLSCLK